ncbi:MAG: hypothetical protein AVDCRST_MAG66-3912, partial [uncultured Pseudonocardia sp.]
WTSARRGGREPFGPTVIDGLRRVSPVAGRGRIPRPRRSRRGRRPSWRALRWRRFDTWCDSRA